MLELIGVSKRYGDAVALHPTTLSFHASKMYVLLGTSGCGKSTLLRIALGLIAPTTGSVKFDDRMVEAKNLQQFRHRVGYVVQQGGLFPHLTALENVSLCATYLGWSETRIRSRVEELAALSQLPSEVLDRYPDELSGGQQQRVGLMRALMLDPEVLLLDEPLGALDPLIRSELQADLREIFRSLSKTVVLVTHDLHEAAYFADQVVLLRDGRVVQQGSIKDLVNAPSEPFVERFIRAQRHTLSLSTFGEDCE